MLVLFALAGCGGGDEEKVSDNDLTVSVTRQKVAVYCLATTEGEPTDLQWREKQEAVRDLIRLLDEDPEVAREAAADAAEMLDDCGESDDAARLDRARERS